MSFHRAGEPLPLPASFYKFSRNQNSLPGIDKLASIVNLTYIWRDLQVIRFWIGV
ncbi:MAG: hypothetical protein AB4426_29465 [Xenococcaceae cyanobacterium]